MALLPEEVITVPGAFAAGMSVGGAKANLEIEAGHEYQKMLDNGISEPTAKKIAMAVGAGNAALELVQLDELAKSFKVLKKSGASDTLLQTVMNELKRRGLDVAKETAQEVAQEGVTIAGTQAGSKIDKGEWAYSAEEVAGRLGGTAVSSALTFGLMNAPGGVRNVYTQRQGENGNKKSSPEEAVRETAKVKQPAASAAAKTQQAASDAAKTQQTAEEQRTSEEVERIIEAFTTDDGYVDEQKQKQLIYYHGEELFNRAVTEAFERGLITNDGRGNIYSLKAETRAPGYYGSKGKEAKYLDSLAKAANMTILRGDLESGEMGFYINGRAVLAEDAGVEIARHEVAHHLKQAAPEEFNAFLDYVKGTYGESVDVALERIRSDYAERGETLSDAVAEEELAAYYAGQLMTDETAMKRLAGEKLSLAERLLDWIRQSFAKISRALGMESDEVKQLREGAALFENAIRAAKSGAEETDGVVRHAIETLPDGKKYVRADRQVTFGNDPESWKEQLQNYINGKIRRGQDITLLGADGDELLLTSESAGKLSSKYFGSKRGNTREMSEREYERKVNAASHIDELLQVSTRGEGNEPDIGGYHGEEASGGWNYRKACFRDFDNKYYKVTVSTMIGKDGVRVYNVGKMQERSIPQVGGSSAENSGAQTGNASVDSISDSAGNSNTESTGKRSAYEDTAEQLKEDYGVGSVNDLPFRWTPPNERSMFNSTSKQLCEIEGPKKALDLGWW